MLAAKNIIHSQIIRTLVMWINYNNILKICSCEAILKNGGKGRSHVEPILKHRLAKLLDVVCFLSVVVH